MIEKKYLAPNAITAGNMLLGYLSITASIKGNYIGAVWFIIFAMVFDTLDGKAARKFDAFSEFGKEFDSFCDAISFGLAPGILIFSILSKSSSFSHFIVPISFVYALFGVIRLVKFNIMTTASSEKDDFSGMPIPCGASLVVSYYLLTASLKENNFLGNLNIFSYEVFVFIALLSAVLMVSTIPFKTPDKVFKFISKKLMLPFFILIVVTLKYSLFIFTAYYVLVNVSAHFSKIFFKTEE
ncbi:MAG: CDP-diacylglycerol--serine O-phosphatidyltransferase [Fusobacteriaceae bacterium]